MTLLEHDPRFDHDDDQADDVDVVRLPALNWAFVLDDVPWPGLWRNQGRCRNAPWTLFFPERGDDASTAKQICAGCGVLDQCRAYALDAGQSLRGIWGGLSERDRRRHRRTT